MLEAVKPILRAAAIAAFVVGLLLLLVNPPSLSGLGGLVSLLAGALALVLLSAWGTVVLMGRDAISEREFERVVRRSEAIAHGELDEDGELDTDDDEDELDDFESLVADAIDRLPSEFQRVLADVPVVVRRRGGRARRAYGIYQGDTVARDDYGDRIVLYRDTLERDFGHDPDLLRAQVERTVRHELAHHLGWDEPGVRGLGL